MPKLKEVRYDVIGGPDQAWVEKVGNFIFAKGFCTIKLNLKDDGIADDLKKLKLEGALKPPPAEVDDGYLGSEGSSAIMSIDGSRPELQGLSTAFQALGESLRPLMRTMLGPGDVCMTPSVLHITGEPEDEDDRPELADDGCTKYQDIFSSHRLMLVYFLGPGQGSMEMEPFFMQDASPYIQTTELGMLMLLRPDMLTHRHFSNRETAAVSMFMLQDVKDMPIRTPTTDLLNAFAEHRMASLKEGVDDFSVVPKEWISQMNKSYLSGPQVAARSIACKYPVSWDPKAWWYSTTVGMDYIVEVPYTRWDIKKMYDPDPDSYKQWKTCSKHMSHMDGLDLFDNKLFGLSPAEAKSMDPQQRHILEVSYNALHDCGFTKKTLSKSLIGVFLGCCCQAEWGMLPMDADSGGAATTGGAASIHSNRISFCLGMQGPSYTLDLNSSASLVAITQAYNSQRFQTDTYKPCHTALGGAMYISFVAHNFVLTCAQGFMSNKGRSLSFDATANGWAKGEGLATMCLQKLGDVVDGKTVVDSDKPYFGTVAGCTVGHAGGSASFNAPNGPIEQELIHGAVRQAQVATSEIDCVEACGDGRPLYDAVEAMSLSNALRLNESNPLVISAVKTSIGMQHETCGMSQLIRALFNLRIGVHAPSNHLIELNPHIDIWNEDRPLMFATETIPVKGSANFTGMTARAHGGTISHVIAFCQIDEKQRPSAVPKFTPPQISFWPGGGGRLEDSAKPQNTYHIVGSWSNFAVSEPMQKETKDLYSFVVTIGVNGFEQFQLCLDGNMEKMLHPDSAMATPNSSVCGPSVDDDARGLQWMIGASSSASSTANADGGQLALASRSTASPGDKYLVKLRVAGRWRVVDWECCERAPSRVEPEDNGTYYVVGNWSAWCCDEELTKTSKGLYEVNVVLISRVGKFQLVRNKDWSQMFYPQGDKVGGPGTASYSSSWSIEGSVGDIYRIVMQRSWQEGAFSTNVSWSKVGTKTAADVGEASWPRYFLVGAGTTSKFELETLSNMSYGITLQLTTGPVNFQILQDGDSRKTFYPSELYTTASRRHIILGPDVAPDARNCWVVKRDLDDTSEEGGWYTVELTVNPIDKTPSRVSWMRIA